MDSDELENEQEEPLSELGFDDEEPETFEEPEENTDEQVFQEPDWGLGEEKYRKKTPLPPFWQFHKNFFKKRFF